MPAKTTAPSVRRLRTYSFDPSLDRDMAAAVINQATLKVPWEDLTPGPVSEYLEVMDFDPASDASTSPSISTILTSLPATVFPRPTAILSFISRWSTLLR